MKKLFISQPMRDKIDEEILRVRNIAIERAKKTLDDDIEVMVEFGENDEIEVVEEKIETTVMLIIRVEFEVMVEMVIYEVNDEILLQ